MEPVLTGTNGRSWRADETYDFYLSPTRDLGAAKTFFRRCLAGTHHPRPRVINVDGNPSYPKAVTELKRERKLGRRCRCRTCPYLNNIVEQDHRAVSGASHINRDSGPLRGRGGRSKVTRRCT